MKDLTTTSYALLVHLALRPWSAFDLAKQMRRGLDLIWPRAESALYAEPKNLVAHGLARARREPSGRRFRTVYSITPKGRRELARWLSTRTEPPQLESEPLIRVFFAENGTTDDLLATIMEVEAFAAAMHERLVDQIAGYLADGGPFTERWHVIGIGARYLLDYSAATEAWARWARRRIRDWPGGVSSPAGAGAELLSENLRVHAPPGRGRRQSTALEAAAAGSAPSGSGGSTKPTSSASARARRRA